MANPRAAGWAKHRCELCGRELNGSREWTIHLASRGHRAAVRKARLRQERRPGSGPSNTNAVAGSTAVASESVPAPDADEGRDDDSTGRPADGAPL